MESSPNPQIRGLTYSDCRLIWNLQRLHSTFSIESPILNPKVTSITRKSWNPTKHKSRPIITGNLLFRSVNASHLWAVETGTVQVKYSDKDFVMTIDGLYFEKFLLSIISNGQVVEEMVFHSG
jgi:hypothetical protein